jgi:tetratricopeptide (TPR) repeat protein
MAKPETEARKLKAPRESNRPLIKCSGAVLLWVIIWAVYGRAMHSPFIFDDSATINENQSLRHLWPLFGNVHHPGPLNPAKELPTAGRPLVNFTFALNFQFSGAKSTNGYHVINLIIHMLTAFLLWRIVARTLKLDFFKGQFTASAEPLGWVTALLWAIHPLNTEAVVYITQRTELMVGLFYLATLLCSLEYWLAPESGKRRWIVLATLASLAGMASKEVMATAPIVVLLYERTFISGTLRAALRRSWPLYVGLFGSWILLLALNISGPRSGTAGFNLEVPPLVWWYTQAEVIWMYLKLCIWPWPLLLHYELVYLGALKIAWPWLLASILLAAATCILLWRRFAAGFVGAWMFLILSPTLVVPIVTEVAVERRMYLPLAAITALVVVGGYWLMQRIGESLSLEKSGNTLKNRILFGSGIGLAAAIFITWCALDVNRLSAYQDEVVLWQNILPYYPNDSAAHYNLGFLLSSRGQYKEAATSYGHAVDLNPDMPDPQSSLALALAKSGQFEQAIAHYESAIKLKPDYADAHVNLGIALIQAGRMSEAVPHFVRALEIKPDDARAHYNLAKAMATLGQPQKAVEQFRLAVDANPEFVDAYVNLGVLLLQSGRVPEAINQFESAIQVDADFAEAHSNLGVALTQAKRANEAIEQFEQALRLKPSYLQAAASLPQAYAEANRPQDAVAAAEKAIMLARDQGQAAIAQQIQNWLTNYRAQHANLPSSNDASGNAGKSQ